jgi:hypothetical protein
MKNHRRKFAKSHVFWPSNIQVADDDMHAEFVAKLSVILQKYGARSNAKNEAERERACRWLIDGLYQSFFYAPQAPLLLPLGKSAYGPKSQYKIPFSHRVVNDVLKATELAQFVSVVKGVYVPDGEGIVTRLYPNGRLLEHFKTQGLRWRFTPPPDKHDGLFINPGRGPKNRRLVQRDESSTVPMMQDNLLRINDFLSRQCISIDLPNAAFAANFGNGKATAKRGKMMPFKKLSALGKQTINMQSVFLHRIFAEGSLFKGGRFYGGWWQQIPSKARRRILINDDITIECDFSGLSCSMLYAMEGLSPPHDAYEIGLNYLKNDPRRKIVKRYMNAVLNDSSRRYRLAPDELECIGLSHGELHARLSNLHKPIAKYFNSGVGVALQFYDSEIAEQVMLNLMEQGEVCLPIHDSFIVRANALGKLKYAMTDAFTKRFSVTPGVKFEFANEGNGMKQPRSAILSAQGLTLAEKIALHMDEYSLIRNFFNSWEQANFTDQQICDRDRALNLEISHRKDLGLPPLHRHKFFGLPLFFLAQHPAALVSTE